MQHIDRLSDYSSEAWDVVTKDDHVYIIDKRTLATHELHAPTGYVWRPEGFSSRVMTVGFSGSKGRDISGAVLLGADGRMISSTIFSQATWSSAAKRFTVERDDHCGVLDSRGHPVVPIRSMQRRDACVGARRSERTVGPGVARMDIHGECGTPNVSSRRRKAAPFGTQSACFARTRPAIRALPAA
jgi:hypothetical protein